MKMQDDKKDIERELLINGAFYKVSEIIYTLGLTDWMHDSTKDHPVLAQELSPYLPAEFYDQFGDKDPSEKELLAANLENFIDTLNMLEEEISNSDIICNQTELDDYICKIKDCMVKELSQIKEEIDREELGNIVDNHFSNLEDSVSAEKEDVMDVER